MQLLRKSRLLFLALLLSLVPASSFAGVLISVGFAPPVLPVYEQPPCPQPGWLWTPGYWAYGDDGYYWVPGAWVPAPYEGALWTPPYWGWSDGLYVFHTGYWGPHVGYYGGVNYGFGFMGVGFVGGMWRGHDFVYNTAVVRVNNVYVHNTYIDRRVVERNTIVNERRVAYSGGPGGINHRAGREELMAMHERHVGVTPVQQQHIQMARSDRSFYAKNNGGRPQTVVAERPLGFNNHGGPGNGRPQQQNSFDNNRGNVNRGDQNRPQQRNSFDNNRGNVNRGEQNRPQFQNRDQQPSRPAQVQNQPSRQPQYQQPPSRQPQYQQQPTRQPEYQQRERGNSQQPRDNYQQPRNESRPAPQMREQPRPAPQQREPARPAPQPREQSRPQHEDHPHR